MKPLIGISTRVRLVSGSTGEQPTHTLARLYTDALSEAGGLPVLLPPQPAEDAVALAGRFDGLVLTGGGDVAAASYGGQHHDSMYEVDGERDDFEMALVREAARIRTPMLAICRGVQVVNVALGGSLVRDIPSEVDGAHPHHLSGEDAFRAHQRVRVDPGSRLAGLLGTEEVLVNSMHHQSVFAAGTGLRPVAWAEDGVVEAVESTGDWPLWAVQWHPECLAPKDRHARRLFEALVEAAAQRTPSRAT